MSSTADIAMKFFEACEAGKGWEACKAHCAPNASFECQADPLAEVKTLQGYTDWMQGLMKMMPDGRYDLQSFAIDEKRNTVTAYAVFNADAKPAQIAGETVGPLVQLAVAELNVVFDQGY